MTETLGKSILVRVSARFELSGVDCMHKSIPVAPSVYLYYDRKPRACQKLRDFAGVGKCPAPGQHKICKSPTPGTDKAGNCPAVARGGGVGEGWAQLELTDALRVDFHCCVIFTCVQT